MKIKFKLIFLTLLTSSIFLVTNKTYCSDSLIGKRYGEGNSDFAITKNDGIDYNNYGLDKNKDLTAYYQGGGTSQKNDGVILNKTDQGKTNTSPAIGYAFWYASVTGKIQEAQKSYNSNTRKQLQRVVYSDSKLSSGIANEGTGTIEKRARQYENVYNNIFSKLKDTKLFNCISRNDGAKVYVSQDEGYYYYGPFELALNCDSSDSSKEILYKELNKKNEGYNDTTAFAKLTGVDGINGTDISFVDRTGKTILFPNFVDYEDFFIKFKPANDGAINQVGLKNPLINVNYIKSFTTDYTKYGSKTGSQTATFSILKRFASTTPSNSSGNTGSGSTTGGSSSNTGSVLTPLFINKDLDQITIGDIEGEPKKAIDATIQQKDREQIPIPTGSSNNAFVTDDINNGRYIAEPDSSVHQWRCWHLDYEGCKVKVTVPVLCTVTDYLGDGSNHVLHIILFYQCKADLQKNGGTTPSDIFGDLTNKGIKDKQKIIDNLPDLNSGEWTVDIKSSCQYAIQHGIKLYKDFLNINGFHNNDYYYSDTGDGYYFIFDKEGNYLVKYPKEVFDKRVNDSSFSSYLNILSVSKKVANELNNKNIGMFLENGLSEIKKRVDKSNEQSKKTNEDSNEQSKKTNEDIFKYHIYKATGYSEKDYKYYVLVENNGDKIVRAFPKNATNEQIKSFFVNYKRSSFFPVGEEQFVIENTSEPKTKGNITIFPDSDKKNNSEDIFKFHIYKATGYSEKDYKYYVLVENNGDKIVRAFPKNATNEQIKSFFVNYKRSSCFPFSEEQFVMENASEPKTKGNIVIFPDSDKKNTLSTPVLKAISIDEGVSLIATQLGTSNSTSNDAIYSSGNNIVIQSSATFDNLSSLEQRITIDSVIPNYANSSTEFANKEINMEIQGTVFLDCSDQIRQYSNVGSSNKNYRGNGRLDTKDEAFAGMQVQLCELEANNNANVIATTTTDKNGKYAFYGLEKEGKGRTLINPLKKYFIIFTYNGQLYQQTYYKDKLGQSYDSNGNVTSNGYSLAREVEKDTDAHYNIEVTRQTINARFEHIYSSGQDSNSNSTYGYYTEIKNDDGKLVNKEFSEVWRSFISQNTYTKSNVENPTDKDCFKVWDRNQSYNYDLSDELKLDSAKDNVEMFIKNSMITSNTYKAGEGQLFPVYNNYVITSVDQNSNTYNERKYTIDNQKLNQVIKDNTNKQKAPAIKPQQKSATNKETIEKERKEKINEVVKFLIDTAKDPRYGYNADDANRFGQNGDYSCSGLVIMSWEKVGGIPVHSKGKATYTGNMYKPFLRYGFKDVVNQVNLRNGKGLQKGDILLNLGVHTATYVGNGKIVEATHNEKGRMTGGKHGDQNGREIRMVPYYYGHWNHVLRYMGNVKNSTSDENKNIPITRSNTVKTTEVNKPKVDAKIIEKNVSKYGIEGSKVKEAFVDGYTSSNNELPVKQIESKSDLIGKMEFKYLYTKSSAQCYYTNYGVYWREEPQLAINQDVYKATIRLNGQQHIYMYNTKGTKEWTVSEKSNEKQYNEIVVQGNERNTYERNLNKADYIYTDTNNNQKTLQAYITYRISIKNIGGVAEKINELVDYYDFNSLSFDGTYNEKNGMFEKHISEAYNENNNIKSQDGKELYVSSYIGKDESGTILNNNLSVTAGSLVNVGSTADGGNAGVSKTLKDTYHAIYLQNIVASDGSEFLQPDQTAYVYVTFRVNNDTNNKIKLDENLDTGELTNGKTNIVEINSYQTRYSNNAVIPDKLAQDDSLINKSNIAGTNAGLIDKYSNPGTITSEDLDDNGFLKTFETRIISNIDEFGNLGQGLIGARLKNIHIIPGLDEALSIIFKIKGKINQTENDQEVTEISGNVFEDNRTKSDSDTGGVATIGDGVYETNEKKIKGVTVELVEFILATNDEGIPVKGNDGNYYFTGERVVERKVATKGQNKKQLEHLDYYSGYKDKVYVVENDTAKALKVSDKINKDEYTDGYYCFRSIPAGIYAIRFKYGDTDRTTLTNASFIEEGGEITNNASGVNTLLQKKGMNEKSYNGQDYKSTIYQSTINQNDVKERENRPLGINGYIDVENRNFTRSSAGSINESLKSIPEEMSDGTDKSKMYVYDIDLGKTNEQMSDAKDIYAYRQKGIDYANGVENGITTGLKNTRAEILQSFEKTATYDTHANGDTLSGRRELQKKMVKELEENTYMVAQSGLIDLENEDNTTISSGVEIGKTNKVTNLNLGLTERPKAQVKVNNEVTLIQLKLADGSVLFDTSKSVKNLFYGKHPGLNISYTNNMLNIPPRYTNRDNQLGLINANIDEEIINGAQVKVCYETTIENVGEVDYLSKQFYYTGKKKNDDIESKTTVKQVVNYVSNGLKYSDGQTDWKISTANELTGKEIKDRYEIKDNRYKSNIMNLQNLQNIDLVNNAYNNQLKTYNLLLTSDKYKGTALSASNTKNKNATTSVKLTSTFESLLSGFIDGENVVFNNITEVLNTTNDQGRRMEYSISGNQEMADQSLGKDRGTDEYAGYDLITPTEIDADSSQKVQFMPPTGANKKYLPYIISTIIAVVIIILGCILIKKKIDKSKTTAKNENNSTEDSNGQMKT